MGVDSYLQEFARLNRKLIDNGPSESLYSEVTELSLVAPLPSLIDIKKYKKEKNG